MSAFDRETFQFLTELTAHNERDWFNANKARYEAHVREPALALIRAMAPRLAAVSPHLVASDKKSGGSLMRVYRDTRFGKDKTPYKTNVGIQFRHARGKDVHAPGFYLHFSVTDLFMAAGMWTPPNPDLAKIRAKIDAEQARWRDVIAAAGAAGWRQGGEESMLKRAPRGYPQEHPLVDDLRRKSHMLVQDLTSAEVTRPDFADRVTGRLQETADYMRFLCEALQVEF